MLPRLRYRTVALRAGLIAALVCLAAASACVSRNVESLTAEEAAELPAPPPPRDAGEARPSVATEPGIEGTIAVADGVAAPAGVLYVIVRVSGREGGAPLAVKSLAGTLPASFTVTSADAMIPGTPLVGDLDVIARLDQDGDAFSRQPGDLEGRVGPVQVGDTVQIELVAADPPEGR